MSNSVNSITHRSSEMPFLLFLLLLSNSFLHILPSPLQELISGLQFINLAAAIHLSFSSRLIFLNVSQMMRILLQSSYRRCRLKKKLLSLSIRPLYRPIHHEITPPKLHQSLFRVFTVSILP